MIQPNVVVTTTTAGTGAYTPGVAVTQDGVLLRDFLGAYGSGTVAFVPYVCRDGTNEEHGFGYWDGGAGTLARTQIVYSTNANAAVNWPSGTKYLWVGLSGNRTPYYTAATNSDTVAQNTVLARTTAGAGPFELVSAPMVGLIQAANAAAAQGVLGGTTVGKALFTAADAAAGIAALGGTTAGQNILQAASVAAQQSILGISYPPGYPLLRVTHYGANRTAGTFSWTKGANTSFVRVVVVGGGGGGARSQAVRGNAKDVGCGGGGGGGAERWIDVTGVSSPVTVVVGAGGEGCQGSSGAGAGGGTSSFGAYLSATGGSGGSDDTNINPATGGVGSSGDVNYHGGDGYLFARYFSPAAVYVNVDAPGGSFMSPPGRASQVNDLWPGGGGRGGNVDAVGQYGSCGYVRVEEYAA